MHEREKGREKKKRKKALHSAQCKMMYNHRDSRFTLFVRALDSFSSGKWECYHEICFTPLPPRCHFSLFCFDFILKLYPLRFAQRNANKTNKNKPHTHTQTSREREKKFEFRICLNHLAMDWTAMNKIGIDGYNTNAETHIWKCMPLKLYIMCNCIVINVVSPPNAITR